MTLDLLLLGTVLLFGVIGALTGAARQVAQAGALAAAYYFARPLGEALGPAVPRGNAGALAIGTVVATFFAAVVLYVGIRMLLTWGLRKVLRKDGDAAPDRTLGFIFGALKVSGLIWVLLSAASFVSAYVKLFGERLPAGLQESTAFALSRRYNLFELTQFAPARDLLEVAQATSNPSARKRLRASPAFKTLEGDPRFREALKDKPVQRAVVGGDMTTLLRSDRVVAMLREPDFRQKLRAAVEAIRAQHGADMPPENDADLR